VNWMRENWRPRSLGEPGHTLDEQMAAAEQRHHHPVDERPLADDDLPDLGHRRLDQKGLLLHGLVEPADVDLGL